MKTEQQIYEKYLRLAEREWLLTEKGKAEFELLKWVLK